MPLLSRQIFSQTPTGLTASCAGSDATAKEHTWCRGTEALRGDYRLQLGMLAQVAYPTVRFARRKLPGASRREK